MTEKLIKQRLPANPPSAPARPGLIAAPARRERNTGRAALIIGPAIGFVLAASLAISFILALAGGAGQAALGTAHSHGSARMAVFVL
ncbi:hypothetical protein AruPA_07835 [Acidiphilium sp. PA]|jgi:hypothetical protein|uniref:hypothetical protein n=1 Tax=Acidiphilium sp. PA TaxID=2871705 RepID=UPI0022435103|nr:hypothetical protein [Acidiphilium sp. PA]MCW8306944.1 hypothetical protein [Acidiphilium sp. PA]